jgi:hypothetical protein
MTTGELCRAVVKAQEIHEASWNADPVKPIYSKSFEVSIQEAMREMDLIATDADLALAHFLMDHAWNDVQDWAKEMA